MNNEIDKMKNIEQDNQNTISWLEKYRPKTLSEYYIEKNQLNIVKTWIEDFRNNTDDAKPFLILYGNAGIGKTTLAYLILNYYNYEIIECNASDTRTKKTIRETIGQISKISVCVDEKNKFKKIAIIMDEIDGLAGGESSSVQELIDIVTKDKDSKTSVYTCPVICTTNSIKDKKLQPLIKQGILLNINKPSTNDCKKLITKISKNENFSILKNDIKNIIDKANGDYRQIIMLLFSYQHSLKYAITDTDKTIVETTNTNTIHKNNSSLDIKNSSLIQSTINYYEEDISHFEIIKKISKTCETPLDKINYFLTNKTRFEDICYMCSVDSNLYYMNLYINIIPIIGIIQNKSRIKTKDSLLKNYKLLYNLYNLIKTADLLNNSIFIDKNWELLDYFDMFGFATPLKILYEYNISNSANLIIPEFNLCHHTQYNFMRQEQSMIKKKLNIDYIKTHNIDLTNIYYNIKRFSIKYKKEIEISNARSKKKKTTATIEESRFQINKSYLKIIDKINELLE